MNPDLSMFICKRFSIKTPNGFACADLSPEEVESVINAISFEIDNPIIPKHIIQKNNIPNEITGKWYDFNRLYVPYSERGKGIGSLLMGQVIEWADENEINIINSVLPSGNLDMAALTIFYEKFGFIEIVKGLMLRFYNKCSL